MMIFRSDGLFYPRHEVTGLCQEFFVTKTILKSKALFHGELKIVASHKKEL